MPYVIISRNSSAALGNQIGEAMTKSLAVKIADDCKARGVLCEVHEFTDGLSRCVHRNWTPKFRSNLASLRLA